MNLYLLHDEDFITVNVESPALNGETLNIMPHVSFHGQAKWLQCFYDSANKKPTKSKSIMHWFNALIQRFPLIPLLRQCLLLLCKRL